MLKAKIEMACVRDIGGLKLLFTCMQLHLSGPPPYTTSKGVHQYVVVFWSIANLHACVRENRRLKRFHRAKARLLEISNLHACLISRFVRKHT